MATKETINVNRDEQGKFAPEEPQRYGRDAEIHDAGLKTLAEHQAEQGEKPIYEATEHGIEQAARDAKARLDDTDQQKRAYIDVSIANVERPAELPEDVALTVEEAAERTAKRMAATRAGLEAQATLEEAEKIAADLGEPLFQQPAQPQPRPDAIQEQPVETPEQQQHRALREAQQKIESDPVLRAALEQNFRAVEEHAQQYVAATQTAVQVAVQSTLSEFPELKNIPAHQLDAAFSIMEGQDPSKAARARAAVATAFSLANEAQRVQTARAQQQEQIARAQFQNWAASQDQAFVSAVPEFANPETRTEIQNETIRMLTEDYGISPQELAQHWNSNPMLRNASTQIPRCPAGTKARYITWDGRARVRGL
jgi:hypothetical protein